MFTTKKTTTTKKKYGKSTLVVPDTGVLDNISGDSKIFCGEGGDHWGAKCVSEGAKIQKWLIFAIFYPREESRGRASNWGGGQISLMPPPPWIATTGHIETFTFVVPVVLHSVVFIRTGTWQYCKIKGFNFPRSLFHKSKMTLEFLREFDLIQCTIFAKLHLLQN